MLFHRFFSRRIMMLLFALALVALVAFMPQCAFSGKLGPTGKPEPHGEYSVLAPITSGNLTVYPVVSSRTYDTSGFLTLDEGVRTGRVVVTEMGLAQPLIRRRGTRPVSGGAEVNRLALINDSDRPLLLLAGEIVTGGKQDRVIGADRIVPPHSDPVDLSVFCVEPGRWVERSEKFSSMNGAMAQPSVRRPAMAEKDQHQVWDNVAKARQGIAASAPAASSTVEVTSSYAGVMENKAVQSSVDKIAAPIQAEYQSVLKKLKQERAVGVVVAINGHIFWADLFASPELLEAYWPKLSRSYAAEAISTSYGGKLLARETAESFLAHLDGRREIVETEPDVYRRAEVTGDGFKVFNIVSLLPKTNFTVHVAKMADDGASAEVRPIMIR